MGVDQLRIRKRVLDLEGERIDLTGQVTDDFFDHEFGIDATRIDCKARPLCRKAAFGR